MFKPRPKQIEILQYKHGKMGISAVPGSGKTQTLSYLAANLLMEGNLEDDQEILIVTLVNSAVNNFSKRISTFLESFGLLPGVGYRVRTLHGLAHDIVRERPDLVGLSNEFIIIDERDAQQIIENSVESWMKQNPGFENLWGNSFYSEKPNSRQTIEWQKALTNVATNFIKTAKDLLYYPLEIQEKLKKLNISDTLLDFGVEIYATYQRALNYRSAVDFEDLIRFALLALQLDYDYLVRLRYQFPYILEDEAQDSSRLQELILQTLTGENGNWVRVGDPNQAIFESFTTASPEYLKSFLKRPDVVAKSLPNSGRSSLSIINLANELIRWTNEDHPIYELRDSLTKPNIEPTPKHDPQPNPADQPEMIHLYNKPLSSDQELQIIVGSLKKWLPENSDKTVAVLVPRNFRGAKIVEKFQQENIPFVEILQTSISTRNTAGVLAAILNFLENPNQTTRLVRVYEVLDPILFGSPKQIKEEVKKLLRSCTYSEDYLFPFPGNDWIEKLETGEPTPKEVSLSLLRTLQIILTRWLRAADLPIHQIIITISQEIFSKPTDLALAHKLALILEKQSKNNPEWLLPQFASELTQIAANRRKIQGFSDEESSFDPDSHKGKVVVTTYHKAKGLEWDRVYLLSVNDYDFPSATIGDQFIAEKNFYKGELNLDAEAIAKLKALAEEDIPGLFMDFGVATEQARLDYAAERLRLFFVGITRAKQELIITWNTGDTHQRRKKPAAPALAFLALSAYWESKNEN